MLPGKIVSRVVNRVPHPSHLRRRSLYSLSGRAEYATDVGVPQSGQNKEPSADFWGGWAGSRRVAAPAGPGFLSVARLWRGVPVQRSLDVAASNLGDLAALKHHLQNGTRLFAPTLQEWPVAFDALQGLFRGFRRALDVNLRHASENLPAFVAELEIAREAVLCKPPEGCKENALIDVRKRNGIHDRIFYPRLAIGSITSVRNATEGARA